jgi:hypothetical protein
MDRTKSETSIDGGLQRRRPWRFRNRVAAILTATLFTVGTSIIALVGAAPDASAQPAPAHLDWDYYVDNMNYSEAYSEGCIQGNVDHSLGKNTLIALDFGAQATNNAGTYLPLSNTYASYAEDEEYAEQYAYGYYICTGTDTTSLLNLAISTNNSGSYVNYTAGWTWSIVVQTVQNWINANAGQVYAMGGNDIESWGSWSAAYDWIQGWQANYSPLYLDFGSADGCPDNGITGGDGYACGAGVGWTQYGYWYAAYGAPDAIVTPEIYYYPMYLQWSYISVYGAYYQGLGIYFYGPLDDHYRDPNSYTPTQAWDLLWLHVPQSTFPYADEQHAN